ncbi:MAG: bifunctional folylpolyglutamate synthase/dihydrofolate synthase [Ignavibacteria bacterium]|nr:bifunctional folylpolyglutamate synthase/dihydrofolate synthase [Ignavibacteria bacterium]
MYGNIIPEIEELYSLQKFGIKLGLENIQSFLELLGNPQKNFKSIHIAGSNGKGSTSSFTASILMEAGFSVGLYTSPHFVRFNERIQALGEYIDDDYVVRFVQKYRDFIHEKRLTFFEATTAMALAYFSSKHVEYAVIETGLGGRLDATNVLKPVASVITSISLEHTEHLGATLELIAAEKAAIIKPGSKAFIGRLPETAMQVVRKHCESVNAELFEVDDYIIERENHIELYTEELDIERLDSPLRGKYQRRNAALAVLTSYEVLDEPDQSIFERGIKNVVRNTRIQGRFELYHTAPAIIFDSAHNEEGLTNFLDEFNESGKKYVNRILIFTALRDKNITAMVELLRNHFTEIYVTTIELDRAYPLDELADVFKMHNVPCQITTDPVAKIKEFMSTASADDCLVVTGSMYLLGAIKQKLENN